MDPNIHGASSYVNNDCIIITLCVGLDTLDQVKRYSSPEQVISELWGITYHMGSHSVTFNPTQVSTPRLTLARQAGTRFTYPGGMLGWVDLGDWLHTESEKPANFNKHKYIRIYKSRCDVACGRYMNVKVEWNDPRMVRRLSAVNLLQVLAAPVSCIRQFRLRYDGLWGRRRPRLHDRWDVLAVRRGILSSLHPVTIYIIVTDVGVTITTTTKLHCVTISDPDFTTDETY